MWGGPACPPRAVRTSRVCPAQIMRAGAAGLKPPACAAALIRGLREIRVRSYPIAFFKKYRVCPAGKSSSWPQTE
jgi:hypothetical protein